MAVRTIPRRSALPSAPQLQRFVLPNVRPTGRQLGHGSYGVVEELEMDGLAVAGKKIYEALVDQGNEGYENEVRKYVTECQLLSDMRHPNIVQFLGLCFAEDTSLPVLVMELLMTNLDDLLECTPNIPLALKRAMLTDAARGLVYLHNHNPRIIHRDLSAKNVLLNSALVAKISDLSNSRIAFLQPGQLAKTPSKVPGTLVYMPPEALYSSPGVDVSKSCDGVKIDIFSFGHLTLFTIAQDASLARDLLPPTYADPHNPNRLLGRSEVERRRDYMTQLDQQLGQGHPLVRLVTKCLENDPAQRPSAGKVLQELQRVEIEDSYQGLTKLDLIRLFEERKEEVIQKVEYIREKAEEIDSLQTELAEVQEQVLGVKAERDETRSEVESLRKQASALTLDNTNLSSLVETKTSRMQVLQQQVDSFQRELTVQHELVRSKDGEIESKEVEILGKKMEIQSKEMESQATQELLAANKQLLAATEQTMEALKAAQNAREQQLTALKQQVDSLQQQVTALRDGLQTKDAEIAVQRERIRLSEEEVGARAEEIAAKEALLRSKERVVQSLRREVESLKQGQQKRSHLHHLSARLKWKRCANLPVGMSRAQCALVGGRIYIGGGDTEAFDCDYNVFEYIQEGDEWSMLAETSWKYFALGEFQGQLITVGGMNEEEDVTGQVCHYEKESEEWKEYVKPLTTARMCLSIVTTRSAIIACGGEVIEMNGKLKPCTTVEVYTSETDQWHTTDPLPARYSDMTIADTWYLLGGDDRCDNPTKTVLCASIPSIIHKAMSHLQLSTAPSQQGTSGSVWKTLPDTPLIYSTAASLGGCLLAVGGGTLDDKAQSAIHVCYSPFKVWIKPTSATVCTYSCQTFRQ